MHKLAITMISAALLVTACNYEFNSDRFLESDTEIKIVCDTSTGIAYLKQHTYSGNFVYTPYIGEDRLPMKCAEVKTFQFTDSNPNRSQQR